MCRDERRRLANEPERINAYVRYFDNWIAKIESQPVSPYPESIHE
jgi:hypothetical protein